MAGEPILIVDDNPTNLKLARVLLAGEGYEVRTALNAEEAVVALAEYRPRLILMDIQLPGMDGLTFTRCLKAVSRNARHRRTGAHRLRHEGRRRASGGSRM